MNTLQGKAILCRLQRHYDRLQQLIDLIGDKRRLDRDERASAQQLLKSIKEEFKREYKLTGQGATPAEIAMLMPALMEASSKIHVATNTIPGQQWIVELQDAQWYLRYYMQQLEKPN